MAVWKRAIDPEAGEFNAAAVVALLAEGQLAAATHFLNAAASRRKQQAASLRH